jgi:hypothetical protein
VPIPWPTGGKLLLLGAFSRDTFSGPRHRGIIDAAIIGKFQLIISDLTEQNFKEYLFFLSFLKI